MRSARAQHRLDRLPDFVGIDIRRNEEVGWGNIGLHTFRCRRSSTTRLQAPARHPVRLVQGRLRGCHGQRPKRIPNAKKSTATKCLHHSRFSRINAERSVGIKPTSMLVPSRARAR
jgi:hypothetical protein